MALKSVWGIDIGKYSIKAVRVDRKKNEFLVGATDIIPYRTLPLFEKDVEWEDLVFESLRALFFQQRIGETPVVVSLTGHQIFNRVIEIASPDVRRLPELVKHEAKQQIPGNIEEVIWEWQDISGPGAVEREIALFAMRRDVVDNFMETLQIAGVQPVAVSVAPLAVCNFLGYDQQPDEPLVILDMGSDSTELLVLEGNRVWIRPLRTAGNDFTRTIRNAAGGQLAEAEKIKRQIGRHPKKDVLLKALEPLQQEMVSEIQRSLGFYKQQAGEGMDFGRLLVLGGGTRIPGFTKGLGRGLQMQVENLTELKRMRVGPKADANLFNANLPVLAPALGLALQGHEATTYQVNLLPSSYAAAISREAKKGWVVGAAVVILIAGLVQFGMFKATQGRMSDLMDEATTLDKELRKQDGELQEAKDHTATLAEREFYLDAIEDRAETLDVLHRLHALLPEENDMDDAPKLEDGEERDLTKREHDVYSKRRCFTTLEMTTITGEEKITTTDEDTGLSKTVKQVMKRVQTSVTVWYHRKAGKSKPAGDFKNKVEAAFPDDSVVVTENPALHDSPDPDSSEDPNGDYVKFQITITRDLGVLSETEVN